MKKILLALIFLLIGRAGQADIILLKNGKVVEGKIIQVRDPFIRLQTNYNTPFREFLIENIANIELSSPNKVSQQAVKIIHQRTMSQVHSRELQEIINQKASAFIEEAIESSESLSLNGASEEVKAVAQKKAGALIAEAVKNVDTTPFQIAPARARVIAQEKAGGLIEEAVKDVGVSSLQSAPEGVQMAAKKAATILINEAVKDVRSSSSQKVSEETSKSAEQAATTLIEEVIKDTRGQSLRSSFYPLNVEAAVPIYTDSPPEQSIFSFSALAVNEKVIGGLVALLFLLLLRLGLGRREKALKALDNGPAASTIEEEPRVKDKRKDPRVKWEAPVLLNLGNVLPITAVVKNISLGGVYVFSDDITLFRLGDQCRFQLNSSRKNPHGEINGRTEVVHIISNRGLGLKFLDMDQPSRHALQEILDYKTGSLV